MFWLRHVWICVSRFVSQRAAKIVIQVVQQRDRAATIKPTLLQRYCVKGFYTASQPAQSQSPASPGADVRRRLFTRLSHDSGEGMSRDSCEDGPPHLFVTLRLLPFCFFFPFAFAFVVGLAFVEFDGDVSSSSELELDELDATGGPSSADFALSAMPRQPRLLSPDFEAATLPHTRLPLPFLLAG